MMQRVAMALGLSLMLGCEPIHPPSETLRPGDYEGLKQSLEHRINREIRQAGVVGLSIAIADGERVVYAGGFGYADKESHVRATAHTVYRVGSVSKSVTAAAVMRLVEDGAIELDGQLQEYLPAFAIQSRFPNAGPVTVRSLLAHHSGLPNVWRRVTANGEPLPYNQLVYDMPNAYLVHPPGLVTKYSSLGYNLLGHLVETAAGRPFAEYADAALLTPLGMDTASYAYAPPPTHVGRLAQAYRSGRPLSSLPSLVGEIPAGGLHASVLDLVRFSGLFLNEGRANGRQVLAPETVRTMLTPALDSPLDFDAHQGLGWYLSSSAGLENIVSQGGSVYPFHSLVIMHPAHRLAVAVCANSAEAGPIVGQIAVEALKGALEVKTGTRPPHIDATHTEAAPKPPASWKAFAGRYQTRAGVVDVTVGKHIEAKLMGQRFRLTPSGNDWHTLRYLLLGSIPIRVAELADVRFAFARVDQRQVILVKDPGGSTIRFGERLQPRPIPEAWRARAGDYNLINAPDAESTFMTTPHAKVRVEDGYLVLYLHLAVPEPTELSWVIFPLTDNEAVFAGLSDYLGGETLQVVQDHGMERFFLAGYKFEQIDEAPREERQLPLGRPSVTPW